MCNYKTENKTFGRMYLWTRGIIMDSCIGYNFMVNFSSDFFHPNFYFTASSAIDLQTIVVSKDIEYLP